MIPHIHYDINVKAYVMIAYIDLMQCVFSNPTGALQHAFAHIHSHVTVCHNTLLHMYTGVLTRAYSINHIIPCTQRQAKIYVLTLAVRVRRRRRELRGRQSHQLTDVRPFLHANRQRTRQQEAVVVVVVTAIPVMFKGEK